MKSLKSLIVKIASHKVTKLSALFAILLGYIGIALNSSEIHEKFLYLKVTSNTYLVSNANTNAVGSATTIRYKGKSYVLSNRHVCEGMKNSVVKLQNYNKTIITKVEAVSPKYDLCYLGSVDSGGLTLKDEVYFGDRVWSVGYQRGWNITVTDGRVLHVIKSYTIMLPQSCAPDLDPAYAAPVEIIGNHGAKLNGCTHVLPNLIQVTSYINNGSSGSPTVDFYGQVVGITSFKFGVPQHGLLVGGSEIIEFLETLK